jgi:hypothetical protein
VCLFRVIPVSAGEGHVGCDSLLGEVDDDGYYCAGLCKARREGLVREDIRSGLGGPSTHEIYGAVYGQFLRPSECKQGERTWKISPVRTCGT